MNIPESDHQIVANLIAFGALLITVITAIYSIRQTKKAKRIAEQANWIAKEANQITMKQYRLSANHPEIEYELDIIPSNQISDSDETMIIFRLRNKSNYDIKINDVKLPHFFENTLKTNQTYELKYNQKRTTVLFLIEEFSRSISAEAVEESISSDEANQKYEHLVLELMIINSIEISLTTEFGENYHQSIKYNSEKKVFQGFMTKES